jgi:ATP-dependent DNA helicase PIF1
MDQSSLSPEQVEIFERVKNRENIFMTGPGGSGKTFLIREIYNWYTQREIKNIQVCALTGCAAVLLQCNAKTIHSWAGIGIANGEALNIINNVSYNKFKRKKWLTTDILIVDEVSMLSNKLLTILDGIAKKVRKNNLPFGGIQILFSGDFYQLPPVGNSGEPETSEFCFESPIWNTLFHKQIALKQIFRQTDQIYASVLNQIREGRLNKSGYELLMSRCIPCEDDTIRPTKILPRRNDVNRINEMEMKSLQTEERKFAMQIVKTNPEDTRTTYLNPEQIKNDLENLKSNLMAEKDLILKVGAQVMCIVNMETEGTNPIVNGSRGVVVDFAETGIPIVKFKCGLIRPINYHIWELEGEMEMKKGYGIKQIPLILAWAITIHKSQGSTLELAEIDIGNGIFECGQSYVALSRVKDVEGLYLRSFNPSKIKISKKVQDFYKTF